MKRTDIHRPEVFQDAQERQNATGYPWENLTLGQKAVRVREELNRHPSNVRPDFELTFLLAG
jgi:hypothetical protein